MPNLINHDNATSNVLAWSSHSANVEPSAEEDAGADADEPPDIPPPVARVPDQFQRTAIRRPSGHYESLLTMALQSHSEEETVDTNPGFINSKRRRSVTSNASLASTAELTCDTGITTPARTSSPGSHEAVVGIVAPPYGGVNSKRDILVATSVTKRDADASRRPQGDPAPRVPPKDAAVQALEKKRCISFACAAKPVPPASTILATAKPKDSNSQTAAADAPKRPCIKFACPSRPLPQHTPPQGQNSVPRFRASKSPMPDRESSPTTVRKHRLSSAGQGRSHRSITPRRSSRSPSAIRPKKYLTANTKDLLSECSRFHEFASDEPQQDDWIRQDEPSLGRRLTINDTLEKENEIRKLGKEAEEEAEMEEREEDEDGDEDEETPNGEDGDNFDEDEENEDDNEPGFEDDYSGYGSDDDFSDGYNTDNEVGFAESDEEDENDGLVLWTTSQAVKAQLSGATPVCHRSSFCGNHSDSSTCSQNNIRSARLRRAGNERPRRPITPELPDSTDFVCGTLDEDRPLEEAYISCIAARKREKMHIIPQDIDPSFPTSEPEDEDQVDLKGTHQDSEEHIWLHGEIEDLHHEQSRIDERKKKGDKNPSPKRYHSPPPKRHHSPAPKARGRSPRRLFDRQSPRRHGSPPPAQLVKSPPASPVQTVHGIASKPLAFRPGLTHTKSLPRAPAMFPQLKSGRRGRAGTITKEKHVRGAIDIVKGLERKRQRRREKFYQKHCNRARKGQVQERRPAPGQGAERMKELGLLMAGKLQGNYVLSV